MLAILLFENNTSVTQFRLCQRMMDIIDPQWRVKLISIGTDGERTMTGCLSDVQTRFHVAADLPIVRVWCDLHQFDLIAVEKYRALCDDTLVTFLTGLVAWLRRPRNLQMSVKMTCPKFMNTRWLSMKRLSKWLLSHRVMRCDCSLGFMQGPSRSHDVTQSTSRTVHEAVRVTL
eukprot:IDg10277t1